jgi:hypothetical protein
MRGMAVAVAFLLAASVNGGLEHTLLHGLQLGHVKAWVTSDEVPGLTTDKLQAAAEARLEGSGVRQNPQSDVDLFVGATVVVLPSGECAVYVEARTLEGAKLDRNGLRVEASSWNGKAVVAGRRENCGSSALTATRHVVDDFVEQYRAMNGMPSRK